MDKYTFQAFFNVFGPFLAVLLFAVLCAYVPKAVFVIMGLMGVGMVILVSIIIRDEAERLRKLQKRNI